MAALTHDIPAGPVITSPTNEQEVATDEDLEATWDTVPDPDFPDSVIEFYEVVVEKDEDDERLRVFSVHMLPGDNSVRVPQECLEAGKDYKVEIIAQETSCNRATAEIPLATEED